MKKYFKWILRKNNLVIFVQGQGDRATVGWEFSSKNIHFFCQQFQHKYSGKKRQISSYLLKGQDRFWRWRTIYLIYQSFNHSYIIWDGHLFVFIWDILWGCEYICHAFWPFWIFFLAVAGIPAKKLVEAHGTFATATCTVCRREYQGEDLRVSVIIMHQINQSIM